MQTKKKAIRDLPLGVKSLEGWGVILDHCWLVGAAQTQEEARTIREAYRKRAQESHRPIVSLDVLVIRACPA